MENENIDKVDLAFMLKTPELPRDPEPETQSLLESAKDVPDLLRKIKTKEASPPPTKVAPPPTENSEPEEEELKKADVDDIRSKFKDDDFKPLFEDKAPAPATPTPSDDADFLSQVSEEDREVVEI